MWKEMTLAGRALCRSPGFTLVAAATLALGVGANTAIFTIVRGVLLKPLPYEAPERLIRFWTTWDEFPRGSISEPEYFDYRDQNRAFQHLAIYRGRSSNVTVAQGDPQRILILDATGDFFPMLGVGSLHGRTLQPEDDEPGSTPVAVASHRFWRQSLGGETAAVGRTIRIEGEEHILVGVMPSHFAYPGPEIDLWRTRRLDRASLSNRGNHSYSGMARLRAGTSIERAQFEMSAIASRLQEQFPDHYPEDSGFGLILVPLFEHVVGSVRPALLALTVAVGFVLLIACANVANLTLVRASAREKEMALRSALGAGRARLVAGSLAESSIVAAGGAALGLVVAIVCLRALRAFGPDAVPRLESARLDGSVLGFAVLLTAATVVLFGLIPALRLSRLASAHRDPGMRATAGRESQRLRGGLVVVQIALAVVLLVGAGLLLRTFEKLLEVDPGFRPEGVLTLEVSLGEDRYPEREQQAQFFREVVEALQNVPGVAAAGAISNPPLSGWSNDNSIEVEGFDPPRGFNVFDEMRLVAGQYFETLGIPLLDGELFTGGETGTGAQVVIVSEALAKKYWGEESPIGRRLRLDDDEPWKTVIGVVGDVHHQGLAKPVRPTCYFPHAQHPWRGMTLVARAAGEPEAVAGSVRRAAAGIDRSQPFFDVRMMNDFVSENVARPRFQTFLFGAFSMLALTLAAIGIYGVVAYAVGQRTREIGIRMALGASQRAIPWLVARQGVVLVAAGVGLGVGLALALSRLVSSLLFAVSERDPVTFVAVPVLLAIVAFAACYVPARRAARVNPVIALRYE